MRDASPAPWPIAEQWYMHRDFAGGMIHGSTVWPEREPGPEQGSVLYGLAATVHLPSMLVRCGQIVRLVSHMPAVCGSWRVLQRANAPPICTANATTVAADFAAFCAALMGVIGFTHAVMAAGSHAAERLQVTACACVHWAAAESAGALASLLLHNYFCASVAMLATTILFLRCSLGLEALKVPGTPVRAWARERASTGVKATYLVVRSAHHSVLQFSELL